MRPLVFIVCFFVALPAIAAESAAVLLERAIQLDVTAGKTDTAADLYKQIIEQKSPATGRRTRAEALYRLGELRAREKAYDDARLLFFELLREFPDAQDLIPLANDAMGRVSSLGTQDKFATNPAATQRIGDLVIALRGALENAAPKGGPSEPRELARAAVLVERLDSTLAPLVVGTDAMELLLRLKARTTNVASALQNQGAEAALAEMGKTPEFDTFMQRGFPADPNDLFAPAWRLKDKLARALAASDFDNSRGFAIQLEKYLTPMSFLPTGMREGTLARAIVSATRDIQQSLAKKNWTEARTRLDDLNEERHEQYAGFQPLASGLPMRMPELYVAAEWVVLHFTKIANTETTTRKVALALDHIGQARQICHTALQGVDQRDIGALFQSQDEALAAAEIALQTDQFGAALQALKRVVTRKP